MSAGFALYFVRPFLHKNSGSLSFPLMSFPVCIKGQRKFPCVILYSENFLLCNLNDCWMGELLTMWKREA